MNNFRHADLPTTAGTFEKFIIRASKNSTFSKNVKSQCTLNVCAQEDQVIVCRV